MRKYRKIYGIFKQKHKVVSIKSDKSVIKISNTIDCDHRARTAMQLDGTELAIWAKTDSYDQLTSSMGTKDSQPKEEKSLR